MEGLLSQFRKVFADLVGLPPDYSMVHHIPLKEGIDLVNVRPYRYPHVMKREIEQQVVEMLKTGVIRPNHSPCSSAIILVKKKDES